MGSVNAKARFSREKLAMYERIMARYVQGLGVGGWVSG